MFEYSVKVLKYYYKKKMIEGILIFLNRRLNFILQLIYLISIITVVNKRNKNKWKNLKKMKENTDTMTKLLEKVK